MDIVNNTVCHTPHYHSTLKKSRTIKGSYGVYVEPSLGMSKTLDRLGKKR